MILPSSTCPAPSDPEHPPVGALLHALDVQLAKQEALVVRRVRRRLGDGRAALSRSGPGPPRGLSRLFGARPAAGLGSVPGSGPVGTGSLLRQAVGQARRLTAGLRTERGWVNI